MRIYLVRHGETLWNAEGRFQGSIDIELSEKGVKQSLALAAFMKDTRLDCIYSSTLKRAFVTADNIAKPKGITVIRDERLKEINCGEWEGKTWAEIQAAWPELSAQWSLAGGNVKMPGGESYQELKDRVTAALFDIIGKGGQDIMLVMHGAAIRALICGMLDLDITKRLCFDVYNTAVGIFDYNPESKRFKVALMNSTEHLPKELK